MSAFSKFQQVVDQKIRNRNRPHWNDDVVVTSGDPIKTPGQTYRNEVVWLRGRVIGRFQTDEQTGKTISISSEELSGARRGRNLRWLIDQAEREAWLGQNEFLHQRQVDFKRRRGGHF
jgi:hypothetical protein